MTLSYFIRPRPWAVAAAIIELNTFYLTVAVLSLKLMYIALLKKQDLCFAFHVLQLKCMSFIILSRYLRILALTLACSLGDAGCRNNATMKFNEWMDNPTVTNNP